MKFKNSDLTPIYPHQIKPISEGPYLAWAINYPKSLFLKLNTKGQPFFPSYWDGELWRKEKNGDLCTSQNLYWRGLNRDPRMIEKERGE